jgi:hypothetical protein
VLGVMNVAALLSIHNRLALLASMEPLANEPRVKDYDEIEEPRGPYPDPKVRCMKAEYQFPNLKVSVLFVEYLNSNHLLFEISRESSEPEHSHEYSTVINKRNIVNEPIQRLYTAISALNSTQTLKNVNGGIIEMEIEYQHMRSLTEYFNVINTTLVPVKPSNIIRSPLFPEFIAHDGDAAIFDQQFVLVVCNLFETFAANMRTGLLTYIQLLPMGPQREKQGVQP